QIGGLEVSRIVDVPEHALTAAFVGWEPIQVELFELHDEVERREKLRGARARIDHIAIEVTDIDQTYAELRRRCVEAVTDGPEQIGSVRLFFTKPESSRGITY